ncbi:MAG: YlxM family DNA-binding protein [Clostridiaceae bacterium]|nr:YlxM family DNA-binding protein [Clostridiaceae bacterium]
MKNVYEIGLLADFYGQLLTRRQYEIIDMYYNNDYSLGEIAEHLGISRQGVYDNLKRGKNLLIGFEKKMGLVEKHLKREYAVKKIMELISELDARDTNSNNREGYRKIVECLESLKED